VGTSPARWWPIDALGTLLAILFLGASVGLFRGEPWARRAAIAAAGVALATGVVLVTTLALTASYVAGLYGPVGQGGALILSAVAALLLPYLVILPSAQLWVLAAPRTAPPPADAPREKPAERSAA
jgi:hypothetical protein